MDMDFSFVLPMRNEDLLNSKGDAYYVKNVYNYDSIGAKYVECKKCVMVNRDPFHLFDHFDTYFSILRCASTKTEFYSILVNSFGLLVITADQLGVRLTEFLAKSEGVTPQERKKYLNVTKMTIFLLVKIVCKVDKLAMDVQEKAQQNAQKKRGKQTDAFEQLFPEWQKKRAKFLVLLSDFLQHKLEKLWSPPVVEENFISLICDVCYRTLELPQRIDSNGVAITLFTILGTAIKKYNHGLTFPVRILQILRTQESAAPAVASGICLLVHEYNAATIIPKLFKDIVESVSLDSADIAVTRNFSHFLVELSRSEPKLIIPHLSSLGDDLLNCESHVLRSCLLQIMGDAIGAELTVEQLSDELKYARDDFLERLVAHINDISAHVRVKVLQILLTLADHNAVPLQFQQQVLSEAVDRLSDKTSSVRKHAVELIKAFMERNPFAPKLSLGQLKKNYNEECDKMEKLKIEVETNRAKIEELNKNFASIVPDLLPAIELDFLENPTYNHCNESVENMLSQIGDLLLQKKYREAVQLIRKADMLLGNEGFLNATTSGGTNLLVVKQYYISTLKTHLFTSQVNPDLSERYATSIKNVEFFKDSIEFANIISRAVPKIQNMLLSKTNTDVFEAVEFFTTCFFFGITGTESGLRQMLLLLWHSDKEKRDKVTEAYKKIHFNTDQTGRAHAIKVMQNLSKFLQELDSGHYICLEYLMKEWVKSNAIDNLIIQCLFERFTMKLEGTTPNQSRLALQLLIMCSSVNSSIVTSNLHIIEEIGFGDRACRDPRLFTSCLEFLLNSIDASLTHKYYKRYMPENTLVHKVKKLFKAFFLNPHTPDFEKMGMNTLQFFYKMCQSPDVIVQGVLLDILKHFRERFKAVESQSQPLSSENAFAQLSSDRQSQSMEQDNAAQYQMPTLLIARFLYLLGQTMVREIIFIDMDVYNNIKFKSDLYEEQQKKLKNATNQVARRTTVNLNMSAMESLKRLSVTSADRQQEPDDDLVGGTTGIDDFADFVSQICEKELLHNEIALIPAFVPFIIDVCQYPIKYNNDYLQQAASLCLIRLMCVSSVFCQEHMSFLMNILSKTTNIKIKCNIVQGLSDLYFRFPNTIEPWTGHFYANIHEENAELRLTAVKMLSHLILHEMIRVKGQIADLALCIVDSVDEIRNMTEDFFKEIAHKSNILYNVLPDIISKLSDPKLQLEEEKYRTIMRYILGLIQKDRQIETLIDKLCMRFTVTREERQWRDTAYCLSLLSYNERSIKKLTDNIHHFKDKVQHDEVYQLFKQIINSTSKTKAEMKSACEEFDTRLKECLEVHDENGDASSIVLPTQKANKTKGKKPAAKAVKSRTSQRGRLRRINKDTSSEDDSSSSSDSEPNRVAPRKAASRVASKTRKSSSISSASSSASEDTDLDSPVKSKGKGNSNNNKASIPSTSNRRNTVRQVVLQDSTSISSDSEVQRPQRKRGRN